MSRPERALLVALCFFALTGCTKAVNSFLSSPLTGFTSTPAGTPADPSAGVIYTFTGPASSYPAVGTTTSNTMNVTVSSSSQSGVIAPNIPTVSVTVCGITPPANCAVNAPCNCQTVSNILLDTGSTGLRVFKSVLESGNAIKGLVPITSLTAAAGSTAQGGATLAECITYGDSTSDWGSVQYAYVQLAGEPLVAVPIQVIESSYVSPPSDCMSPNSFPDTDPAEAGFNGVLGVQPLVQDCGPDCITDTSNAEYYTCVGGQCNGAALVALNAQVSNVVASEPSDNNGVSLTFPAVGATGKSSVTGTLTIGIPNTGVLPNSPSVLSCDAITGSGSTAYVDPVFAAVTGTGTGWTNASGLFGFIDSGSNSYDFASSSISTCYVDQQVGSIQYQTQYFCPTPGPTSVPFTNLSIVNSVVQVQGASSVSLSIGDAATLLSNSSNQVFSNLGAPLPSALASGTNGVIDYGLPFFFGRTIYFGIYGKPSTLGTGAYFAY